MTKYEIKPKKTIMIGVDLQKAFGETVPVPEAPTAVENAKLALGHYRQLDLGRTVLTRHVYKDPREIGRLGDFIPNIYDILNVSSPLTQFYDGVHEHSDIVIDKTRFDALWWESPLTELITHQARDTAIVCGLTTPICVESTVRALMMLNVRVILLKDACASQQLGNLNPQQAHDAAVQTMGALFAETITTAEFIARTS